MLNTIQHNTSLLNYICITCIHMKKSTALLYTHLLCGLLRLFRDTLNVTNLSASRGPYDTYLYIACIQLSAFGRIYIQTAIPSE